MSDSIPILNQVRVASPCSARWDEMEGNERVRFCSSCRKHVYNLSALTSVQAEGLLRERGADLCGRFYRRPDGTVLTADCPIGFAAARRALLIPASFVLGTLLALPGAAALLRRVRWESWSVWDQPPFYDVALRLGIRRRQEIAGAIAMPPPTSAR